MSYSPNWESAVLTYKQTKADYKYIEDIWTLDSGLITHIKQIMADELTEAERVLIILYAEMGSIRAVSKALGIARSTLYGEIKRIKKKIIDELYVTELNEHNRTNGIHH